MPDDNQMRDLFDRWERVWHDGQFDLVPTCIEDNYIRHDEKGDRVVTREAYAAEVATIRKDFRTVVYDHCCSQPGMVPVLIQADRLLKKVSQTP
jgi:hypothetical protein